MSRRTPNYLYFQMKLNLIKQVLSKEMTATAAARSIGKSRQIIHRWMKVYQEGGENALMSRRPGPKKGSAPNRSSAEIESRIIELAKDNPFLGPRPLSDKYKRLTGQVIDQSTVYRILRRNQVRYGRNEPLPRKRPMLYVKGSPGEELQLDTCFPFGRSRKLVCFDVIDDYSRWPEAKLYTHRTHQNAIDFLHYLISRVPFAIKAIRTDRGREFNSEFTRVCQTLGIEHIRNRGYSPENNGKIERWHRTLKEDLIYPYFRFNASVDELQYILSQWLHTFRHQRKHSGLGMKDKTPLQRLIEYYLNPTSESVNLILQQNKT